jgi:hypothetical protein
MGHRAIVMQRIRRAFENRRRRYHPSTLRPPVLAFGLRARASFQEKLLQLGRKYTAKRAPISALSPKFHTCRIRGKF